MKSYISRKHKIQFSHLPKSGCQSVRKFIIKINNDNPDMNIWYDEFVSKYVINTTNTLEGFTHYSIVRNPYSRIVSCYYNKIVGMHWNSYSNYFPTRHNNSRPSFVEFLNRIKNITLKTNEHWTPQVVLINNKNTKILKLEEKEALNNEMMNKTGHSFFHFKPIDHMNTRKDLGQFIGNLDGSELNNMFQRKEQPILDNFYNYETKLLVSNLYKNDFEYLKYDMEI